MLGRHLLDGGRDTGVHAQAAEQSQHRSREQQRNEGVRREGHGEQPRRDDQSPAPEDQRAARREPARDELTDGHPGEGEKDHETREGVAGQVQEPGEEDRRDGGEDAGHRERRTGGQHRPDEGAVDLARHPQAARPQPHPPRDRGPRCERPQPGARQQREREVHHERHDQRRRGDIRDESGEQRTRGETAGVHRDRERAGGGPALGREQVDHRRRARAAHQARAEAGDDAGHDQQRERGRQQEQHGTEDRQRHRDQQHRAPPDLIGEAAEDGERGDDAEGVDREQDGDRERAESELRRVDRVEGRGEGGTHHDHQEREGRAHHGRRDAVGNRGPIKQHE